MTFIITLSRIQRTGNKLNGNNEISIILKTIHTYARILKEKTMFADIIPKPFSQYKPNDKSEKIKQNPRLGWEIF
jgi:hypothetical protein